MASALAGVSEPWQEEEASPLRFCLGTTSAGTLSECLWEPEVVNSGAGDVCAFRLHKHLLANIEPPLSVSGECSLEIYSGTNVITLGLQMSQVPCIIPWDVDNDKRMDIHKNGMILIDLVRWRRVAYSHLASPCSSQTLARVPQLRDWFHLPGHPGMSERQTLMIVIGNSLLVFTVVLCLELWLVSAFFSVENPSRSYLWVQTPLLRMQSVTGAAFTTFTMRHFGSNPAHPSDFSPTQVPHGR